MSDLGDSARGAWIITKRELRSHVKSVRMIILLILFVLAVLGGAYGMSSLSISSDVIKTPEVIGWVLKVDADNQGYSNDLMIYFTDTNGVPVNGVDYNISYETKSTTIPIASANNAPTRSFVYNINESRGFNAYQLQRAMMDYSKGDYKAERMLYDGTLTLQEAFSTRYWMSTQVIDLDGQNMIDDVVVLLMDTKTLEPVNNQTIELYLEENLNSPLRSRVTNSFGFTSFRNLEGGNLDPTSFQSFGNIYIMSASYTVDGVSETTTSFATVIFNISLTELFKTDDPNQVLAYVALMFIVYIGPIVAIALSFDSIAKERLQNSLDFLLARPVSRRAIAIGKYMGTFLAIAIPVTLINIAGIFIIWAKTGNAPDITFAFQFLLMTLAFIAIYVSLQQIFSTLVKSTATAILSGISMWVLFNLFWGLLNLAINTIVGNPIGSDDYLIFTNRFSMLSPNGVYQLAILASLPGAQPSDYVGVTKIQAYLILIGWVVIGFLIAIELFNRRMRD